MTIEHENLYKDVNISTFIKPQHCGWMRYLLRMDDARNTKKIYQANL
jgi:hypothetical protein